MAAHLPLSALLILCTLTNASALLLTIVNNCRYSLWPAIQPNTGHSALEHGGFYLPALSHRTFPAPATHWSGRIWARTDCTNSNNRFSCATGDCGGRLACGGLGGALPATLVQLSLHHGGNDLSSYGVSLVDGFNVPLTVTPHEGKGVCPVIGCKPNLLSTCPGGLQVRGGPHGAVVGCKSGCVAFGTDELCCRNQFSRPGNCRASSYSQFFKSACPETSTFAHDEPSLVHECSSPKELKVIFCH